MMNTRTAMLWVLLSIMTGMILYGIFSGFGSRGSAEPSMAQATSVTEGQPWIWPERTPTPAVISRTGDELRFRHIGALESFRIYPDNKLEKSDRTSIAEGYPEPVYPSATPLVWPTASIPINVTPGSVGGNLPRPPRITPTPAPRDDTLLTPWPYLPLLTTTPVSQGGS